MTRYSVRPMDLTGLQTIPLAARGGKVAVRQFAKRYSAGAGVASLFDSLPAILAGESFREVVAAIDGAKSLGRAVVWGIGGHVIKCGLAPVLVDLMERGFATGFALNGAAAIHDFEIALAGQTSEDVETVLPGGRFGMAEETGRELNEAARSAARDGIGFGEALGRHLEKRADAQFADYSLVLNASKRRVPTTIHVAIGTDTPHLHPECDGTALGGATHHDFRLFCSLIAGINEGGVYINAGSAVVLPEVFLKAVSAVRNLGHPLHEFTTVNLDFLQHYRPRANVVERPHAESGGRGYAITGHHELMIPLLAAALIERDGQRKRTG